MGERRTYAEKLRDPRWQKRRLEVLEAAGWKCSYCERSDGELQVHHLAYMRGRDPWDYPDTGLRSACVECHRREQEKLDELSSLIAGGVSIGRLLGYAMATAALRSGKSLSLSLGEPYDGQRMSNWLEPLLGASAYYRLSVYEAFGWVDDISDYTLTFSAASVRAMGDDGALRNPMPQQIFDTSGCS